MLISLFLPSKKNAKGFIRVIADNEYLNEFTELGYLRTQAEAEAIGLDRDEDDEDNAAPTSKEIRAKARELGITYGPKTKDADLLAKINEKLGK